MDMNDSFSFDSVVAEKSNQQYTVKRMHFLCSNNVLFISSFLLELGSTYSLEHRISFSDQLGMGLCRTEIIV